MGRVAAYRQPPVRHGRCMRLDACVVGYKRCTIGAARGSLPQPEPGIHRFTVLTAVAASRPRFLRSGRRRRILGTLSPDRPARRNRCRATESASPCCSSHYCRLLPVMHRQSTRSPIPRSHGWRRRMRFARPSSRRTASGWPGSRWGPRCRRPSSSPTWAVRARRPQIGTGDDPGIAYAPAWAPDCKRLALLSDAGTSGQMQVFVAAADRPARRLTRLKGALADPRWSPDGKQLGFLFTDNPPRKLGPTQPAAVETGEVGEKVYYQRLNLVDLNPARCGRSRRRTCTSTNTTGRPTASTCVLIAAHGSGRQQLVYRPALRPHAGHGGVPIAS